MIDDEDFAYEQRRQRKLDELAKGDFKICPVCNGECGVQISVNMDESGEPENAAYASDWFDCDNCDATGFVDG